MIEQTGLQRTPEWHAKRCGKVTASRISDMMAQTKSGWGAGRYNYMALLVAERLTGVQEEGYSNAIMQRGSDLEDSARAAYEFYRGVSIEQVDFIDHPTIKFAGASPDGLVGADGLIEMKIPNTATHIEYLRGGTVPKKYDLQMQWQLACTGRQWVDFVSFDPRMPEEMRLFVKRAERDSAKIIQVTAAVVQFQTEVAEAAEELVALYRTAKAA